ncbi:MAG: hypothetical protein IPI67_26930 [Myxococcales bacterium]|nr:hypothetical protein [Myxococcales bacterium]
MSRRAWSYALALAITGGGLPFACWSTRLHERAEPAPAPEIRVEPVRPATVSAPEARELAPGVVKTRLLEESALVNDAVPWQAPTAEHPGGTLVLAAREGLIELDIDKGSVVRRTAAPQGKALCRLAASPVGVAVTWRDQEEAKIAFYDERLELGWTHVLAQQASEVSVDGSHAVAVYDTFPPGSGFELVRFDMSTGRRVAARRHPGSITTFDEYPARLLVRNERIHVLVTRPRIELRSYSLDLSLAGVVHLPFPPHQEGDFPPFGTLDAAGEQLLLSVRGKVFSIDPKTRGVRSLPALPTDFTNENHLDVDPSGRVLVDSGSLAERVGGPFVKVVTLRTEMWKLSAGEEPMYRDTPVAGFFWGGQALIVTVHPDVSLIRIDPARALAAH